jgi:hypothetical protein
MNSASRPPRYKTQLEWFAGETIPTLSAARRFAWGTVTALAETRFKSVGLGFQRGNFQLLLQTNNLKQSEAKVQAVRVAYYYPF